MKLKSKSIVRWAFATGVSALLIACGVKTAQAPRVNVEPSADLSVQEFPPKDVSFADVQLFMWPKDATGEDESEVLDNVGLLEDKKDQIYEMMVQKAAIESQFAALNARLKDEWVHRPQPAPSPSPNPSSTPSPMPSPSPSPSPSTTPPSVSDQLIQVNLLDLQETESTYSRKSAELQELKSELEALKGAPASSQRDSEVKSLNKRIHLWQKKIDSAKAVLMPVMQTLADKKMVDSYESWKTLGKEIEAKQIEANKYLEVVGEHVWVFNSSPMKFSFKFSEDGRISSKIHNWDLSKIDDPEVAEQNVPVDFSTELFTMGRVKYETLGGTFTFEVYSPQAVYWFKMSRALYAARDGRIHYKGDIVRCSLTSEVGRPVIIHERDVVKCGVDLSDYNGMDPSLAGQPVTRRGEASFVDLDVKDIK